MSVLSVILAALPGLVLAHVFAVSVLYFALWVVALEPGRELAPSWDEKLQAFRTAASRTRTAIAHPLYWVIMGLVNASTIFEVLR